MDIVEPVAVWDVRPWGCPAFTVGDFNDGTPLWSHAPISEGDHLDHSAIADIDEDGYFEFALAHDGHDAV